MGLEFFVATIFGPTLLLAIALMSRHGMGLSLHASGADVVLTLAGIDFGIALAAPAGLEATFEGQAFPVFKVALVLLLMCIAAFVAAIRGEKASTLYHAALAGVQQGWCTQVTADGLSRGYWGMAFAWLGVVVCLVPNVALFVSVL